MTVLESAIQLSMIREVEAATPLDQIEKCLSVLGELLEALPNRDRRAAKHEFVGILEGIDRSVPNDKIDQALGLDNDGHDDDDDDSRTSGGDLAIRVVGESEVFLDERGEAYVAFLDQERVRRIEKTSSHRVKSWITGEVYRRAGKPPTKDAVGRACLVLDARATSAVRHTLYNRFAEHDGVLWLDIASQGRAIRVVAGSWAIVEESPILFRPHRHQKKLVEPLPAGKGDLLRILDFVSLDGNDARLLFLVWLVMAARAGCPRPILVLHGPPGAAKTTAARFARSVLDPSGVAALSLPTRPSELAQALFNHGMPVFDNISKLQGWHSDMLCCAATGGGTSSRQLFTDDDEAIMTFKRPVIMTGVNVPAGRSDFLDRCILLELPRISKCDRRTESELWTEFEQALPSILGGLLDVLSDAMRLEAISPSPRELPRMADFARSGAVVAEVLGSGRDNFLTAYNGNLGIQIEEVIEASELARLLLEVAQTRQDVVTEEGWTVSAGELLRLLSARLADPDRPPRGWPARGNLMSRELMYLEHALGERGLSISRGRSAGSRHLVIRWRPPDVRKPSSSASSSSSDVDDGQEEIVV